MESPLPRTPRHIMALSNKSTTRCQKTAIKRFTKKSCNVPARNHISRVKICKIMRMFDRTRSLKVKYRMRSQILVPLRLSPKPTCKSLVPGLKHWVFLVSRTCSLLHLATSAVKTAVIPMSFLLTLAQSPAQVHLSIKLNPLKFLQPQRLLIVGKRMPRPRQRIDLRSRRVLSHKQNVPRRREDDKKKPIHERNVWTAEEVAEYHRKQDLRLEAEAETEHKRSIRRGKQRESYAARVEDEEEAIAREQPVRVGAKRKKVDGIATPCPTNTFRFPDDSPEKTTTATKAVTPCPSNTYRLTYSPDSDEESEEGEEGGAIEDEEGTPKEGVQRKGGKLKTLAEKIDALMPPESETWPPGVYLREVSRLQFVVETQDELDAARGDRRHLLLALSKIPNPIAPENRDTHYISFCERYLQDPEYKDSGDPWWGMDPIEFKKAHTEAIKEIFDDPHHVRPIYSLHYRPQGGKQSQSKPLEPQSGPTVVDFSLKNQNIFGRTRKPIDKASKSGHMTMEDLNRMIFSTSKSRPAAESVGDSRPTPTATAQERLQSSGAAEYSEPRSSADRITLLEPATLGGKGTVTDGDSSLNAEEQPPPSPSAAELFKSSSLEDGITNAESTTPAGNEAIQDTESALKSTLQPRSVNLPANLEKWKPKQPSGLRNVTQMSPLQENGSVKANSSPQVSLENGHPAGQENGVPLWDQPIDSLFSQEVVDAVMAIPQKDMLTYTLPQFIYGPSIFSPEVEAYTKSL